MEEKPRQRRRQREAEFERQFCTLTVCPALCKRLEIQRIRSPLPSKISQGCGGGR